MLFWLQLAGSEGGQLAKMESQLAGATQALAARDQSLAQLREHLAKTETRHSQVTKPPHSRNLSHTIEVTKGRKVSVELCHVSVNFCIDQLRILKGKQITLDLKCLQAVESLRSQLHDRSSALLDANRRFAELEAVMKRIAARGA